MYVSQILMVIDGNSLMHRAFYAIPVLTNKKGVFTNAVYGFTNMLLKLLADYHPTHIAVAFDRKAPTFRHLAYQPYKATRHKAPEELIPQFNLLRSLLIELGIDIYEIDGFEADDILGTLARAAEAKGLETLLVTGDKDALQLITDHTKILFTKKGISEMHIYTQEELKEIYGLLPLQMIDLKGLMGDSSDNIPGVPGVGQKTALKLMQQYGSLESVLANIDEISGNKLKENLTVYQDQARMSKELATIRRDVPIPIVFSEAPYTTPKTPELKGLLEELAFFTVIGKLGLTGIEGKDVEGKDVEGQESEANREPEKKIDKDFSELCDLDELGTVVEELLQEPQLTILLSKEMTLYAQGSRVYKLSFKEDLLGSGMDYIKALELLKPVFEHPGIQKITHDGKRLIRELERYEISFKGLAFDTFIAAYLLNPTQSKYEPEQLLYEYLKVDTMGADAMDVHRLYLHMQAQLKETGMQHLYESVEHPLIDVLANMESAGFLVDKGILNELNVTISKEVDRLTGEIYEAAGERFNLNSPKQLGEVLFEKLGLPVSKKTKTGYSTDIEVLEQLRGAHPVIERMIEFRQVMKLKSTYIDGLLAVIDNRDGRIHTSFNQAVAATGRISSTEPNLQNIPVRLEMGRKIRRIFVASSPDHVLVDADYSQIELRVLAHISQDPTFIESFVRNQDIHRRTAAEIFGIPMEEVTSEQRSSAKAVNFGIVYGISDFGLSRSLGISRAKAKIYIESYLNRYTGVKAYMERIIEEGKAQGYVTTLLGRRRDLPELKSRNFNIRSFGERLALNTPIQGTAADIIKMAMIAVCRELVDRGLKSRLILQVHDELIIDTLKTELAVVQDLVREQMEHAMTLSVPLLVDIGVGDSWYDAK